MCLPSSPAKKTTLEASPIPSDPVPDPTLGGLPARGWLLPGHGDLPQPGVPGAGRRGRCGRCGRGRGGAAVERSAGLAGADAGAWEWKLFGWGRWMDIDGSGGFLCFFLPINSIVIILGFSVKTNHPAIGEPHFRMPRYV